MLLLVWRVIPLKLVYKIQHKTLRMLVMVLGSILAWTVMAVGMRFIIVGLEKAGAPVSIPALVAFAVQVVVAMILTVFGSRYSAKVEGKVKWKLYVIAGVLGLITGIGLVFLSDADDIAGGLLMAFPVILIASVSSLASTYAETFPITATTAMIGGSVATSLYAIVFAEALPIFHKIFVKRAKVDSEAYSASAIAVTTIICWFSCLILISLPLLFILRCLARREKSGIEKVRWTEEDDETKLETSQSNGTGEPTLSLSRGWDKFSFDDDDDDVVSVTETSSLLSTDSLRRTAQRSESENAARRAILEESMNEESPLLFSGVGIPDSPVPVGSSRMSTIPTHTSRSNTPLSYN